MSAPDWGFFSECCIADVFVRRYSRTWKFVHGPNKWYKLQGGDWQPDRVGEIDHLALRLLREAASSREAAASLSAGQRQYLSTPSRAKNILFIAGVSRSMARMPEDLGLPPHKRGR